MTFLHDVKVRPTHIYVKKTKARIPLAPWFIKEFVIGYVFFLWIQGVRLRRALTGAYRPKRVAFYPERPRAWYLMWNVCKYAGVRMVDDPKDADILFHFEDATHTDPRPDLEALGRPMVNAACRDVSKSAVADAFEEVFGYSLRIDPTAHRGRAVEKSEENGRHDGRVVVCPIDAPAPSRVYQKLVNNSEDGAITADLRAPIVGDCIPLVYVKRRRIEDRFTNFNQDVTLKRTEEVFSPEEIRRLLDMARRLGMDSGAFDVLRDGDEKRIYVVDANKTEMGPPIIMKMADKIEAIRRLGRAYAALLN